MLTQVLAAIVAAILFAAVVYATTAMITFDPDAATTDAAPGNTAPPPAKPTAPNAINGNDQSDAAKLQPTRPAIAATAKPRLAIVVTGVQNGQIHLRQAPVRQSSSICAVPDGATVTILHEAEYWFYVRLDDGREGWVTSAYLEVQQ